jgi:archaellum component FlaC
MRAHREVELNRLKLDLNTLRDLYTQTSKSLHQQTEIAKRDRARANELDSRLGELAKKYEENKKAYWRSKEERERLKQENDRFKAEGAKESEATAFTEVSNKYEQLKIKYR